MRAQYVVTLLPARVGLWAEFGCHYPDGELCDWTRQPASWRLTQRGAMRWARRQAERDGRYLDMPMATVVHPQGTCPDCHGAGSRCSDSAPGQVAS